MSLSNRYGWHLPLALVSTDIHSVSCMWLRSTHACRFISGSPLYVAKGACLREGEYKLNFKLHDPKDEAKPFWPLFKVFPEKIARICQTELRATITASHSLLATATAYSDKIAGTFQN